MKRRIKSWKTLIALVLSFVISFAIILIASVPESYDYKEGEAWEGGDVFAPREMEDVITTQNRREAAANQVEDQYSTNNEITKEKEYELKYILDIIKESKNIKLGSNEKNNYVLEELGKAEIDASVIELSDRTMTFLIDMNIVKYSGFSRDVQEVFSEIMNRGVSESKEDEALEDMIYELRKKNTEEELVSVAKELLSNYIVANRTFDSELTEARKEEVRESVAPVIIKENQIIAEAGTVLTEAQIKMLTDIGVIKGKGNNISIKYAVGIFVFMLAFYGIAVYYIRVKSRRKRLSVSKIILACLLPVLMLFIISIFSRYSKNAAYIIPVSWCTILVATFVSLRLSAVMSIYLSFAAAIMLGLPEDYIIAMVILSAISTVIFKRVDSISGYAKAMIYVMGAGVISMAVSMLVTGKTWREILWFAVMGVINGALSSILVIGTTPIFENIFNIITPFKLSDLGNPEKPLLKKLMFEAPGTYHHSLMVGNLAEAACIKVGANNQLARVAAYYHDIGKLRRPEYFVENQMGSNPHDNLMPKESSEVLKGHIEDGIELAKQYRLPNDIQDVIRQHHGKTVTGFFYRKEKEINPDALEDDFRYLGPKPESKEAGIVMLADSCEAAVRSLDEKTEETIRAMVTKIVKGRMADGELDECDLSFRELGEIIDAFVSMLGSHFHKRIKYDVKEPAKDGTDNRKDS